MRKFNHHGRKEVIFISKNELRTVSSIPNPKRTIPAKINKFKFSLLGFKNVRPIK